MLKQIIKTMGTLALLALGIVIYLLLRPAPSEPPPISFATTPTSATKPIVLSGTLDGAFLGDPFWSPNGKQIAFSAYRSNGPGRLEIVNSDGSGLRQAADALDVFLNWSADGSQLFFCLNSVDRQDQNIRLYSVSAEGAEPIDITTTSLSGFLNGENGGCTIVPTPEGKRLAVSTDAYGGLLSVVDLDGEHLHALTPPLMGAYDFAWSPDGSTIIFRSSKPSDLDMVSGLYQVPSDGGATDIVQLARNTSSNAIFSPDGQRIAYAENNDLYLLRGHAAQPVRLAQLPDPISQLAWSPDGVQIALSVGGVENDIYIINADGSDLRYYYNPGLTDLSPRWSPDGKQLAFISSRDPAQDGQLMLIRVDSLRPYPRYDIPPLFRWPLPNLVLAGKDFGEGYPALDLAAAAGDKVFAAAAGTVVCPNQIDLALGNMVEIAHASGYKSLYAHLGQISVDCGQVVAQGQIIGDVGQYGPADKPLLYFELLHRDTPVNPWKLMPAP